jgi:Fur family transcriptional regulator, ferric uptake regulator
VEPARKMFLDRMRERGLRATPERIAILGQATRIRGHFDAEELVLALRRSGARASRATVYRTLAHLVDLGLLRRHEMPEGGARYERWAGRTPHEHLLCIRCGEMLEFIEDGIGRLLDEVCQRHDFLPLTHNLQIRGVCRECRDA